MEIIHRSRSTIFREPAGALPGGSQIRLTIHVTQGQSAVHGATLCYAYGLEHFYTSRIQLKLKSSAVGEGEEPNKLVGDCLVRLPFEACLFFYWFELETAAGRRYFTADREDIHGGGRLTGQPPRRQPGEPYLPSPWQVTVYERDFAVPSWLPGSIIYQIFPDRFNRDTTFSLKRFEENQAPERIWHSDWSEDVDFVGKPETGYLACDFFGGSLAGITEKLDYFQNLGVSILSLNPIFKARSNHRYDTGDYEQIDPLLGDLEDFQKLCLEAAKRGIRIILDGVFSHTGADSRYFNKLGRYEESGAWQAIRGDGSSPYLSWYTFRKRGEQLLYDSWWGFPDLPAVNEHDLLFRDYIIGPNGIVRRWLRLGAAGWRLDVSDELPDGFLRGLRKAARAEKKDAVILGEVWEDASNKISYGSYRDFLLGRTHDTVMGYPFQGTLIGWLSGQCAAERLHLTLASLKENYPVASFYSSYNLISGHDIPRAITALAGQPDPGNREMQSRTFLSSAEREKGKKLLRLAVLFQMTWPGCPVIYYGDETAMEGYRDPFNRRTFPWNQEDQGMQSWFARLGLLRQQLPVLRTGFVEFLYARGDCLAFRRYLKNGLDVFGDIQEGPATVVVAINRHADRRKIDGSGHSVDLEGYGFQLLIDDEIYCWEN
ncbi:MAG: glycoside hydrolase family 13 protein [Clostridiaceae bacterium]|nr:glycoside hydrolase family 13 protein [Clostridiaceae bacterium]